MTMIALIYTIIQEQFNLLVCLVGEEIKKQDVNWRKFMTFLVLEQRRTFGKISCLEGL